VATYSQNGLITIKDTEGDTHQVYPITKDENVNLSSAIISAYDLAAGSKADDVLAKLAGAFIGTPAMKKIAEFNDVSVTTTPTSLSLSGIDLSGYTTLRMVSKISASNPITGGVGAIQAGINNVSASIFYSPSAITEANHAASAANSRYFRVFSYVFGEGVSILNMFMVDGLPVMILRSSVSKLDSSTPSVGATPLYAHILCANYSTALSSLQISGESELINDKGVTLDIVLYGG
jgi:hypothetical protein